jgi:hypothetical protein
MLTILLFSAPEPIKTSVPRSAYMASLQLPNKT